MPLYYNAKEMSRFYFDLFWAGGGRRLGGGVRSYFRLWAIVWWRVVVCYWLLVWSSPVGMWLSPVARWRVMVVGWVADRPLVIQPGAGGHVVVFGVW